MASAPLRPRSARTLTTAATATAHLALATLALANPALANPALAAEAPSAFPRLASAAPALAVVATTPAAAPRAPAPDPPTPTCGTPSGPAFPLDTRLHGGPADYPAGGPPQEWKLDLTNTTAAPCSGIHPVLVLTDRERALRPEQIRFEFYDAGSARWRPVAFEVTEEAENVGAFTGFGGFAVPAGQTLTVPVRLAFRAGTVPDEVVVNAAVVQRRGADGDWVGESGDYRLTVGPAGSETPAESAEPAEPVVPAEPTGPVVPAEPGEPSVSAPAAPSRPPGTVPRPPGFTADPRDPGAHPPGRELASTGRESEAYAQRLAPLAAALVLLGAVLVRSRRSGHLGAVLARARRARTRRA
ncbi:hypothetical protein [Streptomyces sp. NPDC058664]|uniref:hypothetical protein n=1 Tax=unclassified Streptomyces TaxID=2593676 RepID=UPI00364FFDBA